MRLQKVGGVGSKVCFQKVGVESKVCAHNVWEFFCDHSHIGDKQLSASSSLDDKFFVAYSFKK